MSCLSYKKKWRRFHVVLGSSPYKPLENCLRVHYITMQQPQPSSCCVWGLGGGGAFSRSMARNIKLSNCTRWVLNLRVVQVGKRRPWRFTRLLILLPLLLHLSMNKLGPLKKLTRVGMSRSLRVGHLRAFSNATACLHLLPAPKLHVSIVTRTLATGSDGDTIDI